MRRPNRTRAAQLTALAAAALAVWLAASAVGAQAGPGRQSAQISPLGLQVSLEGHDRHVRAGETVGVIVELAAAVTPQEPWRADSFEIISGTCGVGAAACPDDELPRGSNVSRSADPEALFDASGTWIELPSGFSWEHNNRQRLDIGRGNATIRCADRDETGSYDPLPAGARAVATCVFLIVDGASRAFPEMRVPEGTPDGDLLLAAEVRFAGGAHGGLAVGLSNGDGGAESYISGGQREYFDTYDVRVRNAPEVASVDFSWSDGSTEAVVPRGGSITAELALSNAEGDAAAVSQLRSVVVTTPSGSTVRAGPSLGLDSVSGANCAGGRTCTLDDGQLDSAYASQRRRIHDPFSGANPAAPQFYSESNEERGGLRAMEFRLRCDGAGGFGAVTASAIADDGGIWDSDDLPPLRLICGGETIRLVKVPREASSVYFRRTEGDDLDVLRVPIRGEDASGRNSGVPEDAAAFVRDGDGAALGSGASASVECAGANRADCEAVARITSAAGLPRGDYELAVRSSPLPLLVLPFHVSGPPAAIAAASSPNGAVGIGQQLRIELSVTDADGQPVADGTPVELDETPLATGGSETVVRVLADGATRGGRATVAYVAVRPGSTVLTVSSGTASLVHVIRSSAGADAVGGCDAADLSSREPGGYSAWFGAGGECTASELLAQLEGVSAIYLWNSRRWLFYSEVDGRAIPSSSDFAIERADTLFLRP